jgi:hypothetical protein
MNKKVEFLELIPAVLEVKMPIHSFFIEETKFSQKEN